MNFNSEESDNLDDDSEENKYEDIECDEEKIHPLPDSILLEGMNPTSIVLKNSPATVPASSKSRRRSKNVVEGRKFNCSYCDRTYLSHPALYMHIKTKHPNPNDGSKSVPGRSRGRPKKTKFVSKDSDPTTFEYFSGAERTGETNNPIAILLEAIEEMKGIFTSQYEDIKNNPILEKMKEDKNENNWSCDEVFVDYLKNVAKKTNALYFKLVCKFVMLYRECLNKYGWLKLFENIAPQIEAEGPIQSETNSQKISRHILLTEEQVQMMKDEYSRVNNAEFAPEVSNEFAVLFLPEHSSSGLQSNEGINLLINLAEWMFENGYTCTKISLIKTRIPSITKSNI